MHIANRIEELKARVKEMTSDNFHRIGRDRNLEAMLADTVEVVEALSRIHATVLASQIQRLELKDGDALIVKLGDPNTGWIPGAEAEKYVLGLVTELLAAMKVNAPALVYHYGIDLSVIKRDVELQRL